jgi:DNA modification methylase
MNQDFKSKNMGQHEHIIKQLQHLAVPCDSLNCDSANARTHPTKNIKALRASYKRFKQRKPVVVRKAGRVVEAGNGTLEVFRALGWTHIAAVIIDEPATEAAAYALADNRSAELADWDTDILGANLEALIEDGIDVDDLGWTDDELAELIGIEPEPPGNTEGADDIPEAVEVVTKTGDLWILGDHRLLCGDSTSEEAVARLMNGDRAGIVFTSPPYDNQRTYGLESKIDWKALMYGIANGFDVACADDAQILVNLGLIRVKGEVKEYWRPFLDDMKQRGWKLFDWYVWDQTYGTPGHFGGHLAPSHEWIFHLNRGSVDALRPRRIKGPALQKKRAGTRNKDGSLKTIPTGKRNTTAINRSVATIPRTSDRDPDNTHPAAFPVALADFFISSWPGDVYEPFSGSGTTIIACEQLNRRCFALEINPEYVDIAVRRWEKFTGKTATREVAP